MSAQAKHSTALADINGARIAYDLAGAGPAVVLMHAGVCDRRMWDDQFATFANAHRVLRYDARGFGESNRPHGDYAHHDDLASLLQELGIANATLIAVSMSGEIALNASLYYPNLVSALILSTTRAAATQPADAIRQLWSEADTAYEAGNLAEAVEIELRGWVDGPRRASTAVDPTVRERVRVMNTALWERVADEPDGGEERNVEPTVHTRLAAINVPTLLVTGDLDQPEVIASMKTLAATIAGAEHVVISGTAHLPSMERPAEFNRVVLDFLARHRL